MIEMFKHQERERPGLYRTRKGIKDIDLALEFSVLGTGPSKVGITVEFRYNTRNN